MKHWYLVYCSKGKDKDELLVNILNVLNVEVFRPMIISYKARKDRPGTFRKKTIPLFSNYIFVRFDYTQINFSKIVCLEGISGFVRSSDRIAIIPEKLIEDLKQSQRPSPKKVIRPYDDSDNLGNLILNELKEEERIKLLHSALECH